MLGRLARCLLTAVWTRARRPQIWKTDVRALSAGTARLAQAYLQPCGRGDSRLTAGELFYALALDKRNGQDKLLLCQLRLVDVAYQQLDGLLAL